MPSIYRYRDYRSFLKDSFVEKKAENRRCTYRYIAAQLQLKSAGHVTQMVKGQARVTDKTRDLLKELLEVRGRDASYFDLLLAYGQAPSMKEKRELLAAMAAYSGTESIGVSREQLQFYQKWYYSAIRDILTLEPFRGDYSRLARMVEPTITRDEAREAIGVLERLDLIARDEAGLYAATANTLSLTVPDEERLLVNGYAEQMIDRAKYALNVQSREERTIAWAGFSCSTEGYELIREEIRQFRSRIMDIVRSDEQSDRVYHMNIHCFPLSKRIDE